MTTYTSFVRNCVHYASRSWSFDRHITNYVVVLHAVVQSPTLFCLSKYLRHLLIYNSHAVTRTKCLPVFDSFCTFLCRAQTCSLGLHRSDYMVDYSVVSMETQSSTGDGGDSGRLCLRQIEINTIASSFFGLTAHMRGFHE